MTIVIAELSPESLPKYGRTEYPINKESVSRYKTENDAIIMKDTEGIE